MKVRERKIRKRLQADFIHYAEKCLHIRTKQGAIEAFILNDAQKYIHTALEKQMAETGQVRAIILKGRQQGCSTYVEGRFYWKVTHRRGVRAFILTHLEEATRNVYRILKRFHDSCPLLMKPRTSLVNSKEIVFDKLDSGYLVGTARSSGIGRSHTLQYFHGSEVAFWPHAEEHVSGILQAVPDAPETEVILESTSCGAGGFFYKLCMQALEGRSEYIFIFVPWFWQTEYRRTAPIQFSLTEGDLEYKQNFNLDDAQMYWRRIKIAELGGLEVFRREYPATPEEAFQADGPGALWTRAMINKNRCHAGDVPELVRIVVAIDPAVTSRRTSDETGIIVAGLGDDGHGYILEDVSGRYTPDKWAQRAISMYYKYHADRIVAEVNQGGDMVEHTLRTFDPRVSYKSVHASRGKTARAEPIAALDAQGRIHHVGVLEALEDEMCGFDPLKEGKSPDRVDARVWAMTELMLTRKRDKGPQVWS